MTFYLDIYGDELTLKEMLDLANRVIDLTDDPDLEFIPGLEFIYRTP